MFINLEDDDLHRLEIYGLIVGEWIDNKDQTSYDEFKYRITDGEEINQVFIDIIKNNDTSSILLMTIVNRLEEYILEVRNKKFYE